MAYRLSKKAEDDIIRIYREGAVLFGGEQAERYHFELSAVFDLIAANPIDGSLTFADSASDDILAGGPLL